MSTQINPMPKAPRVLWRISRQALLCVALLGTTNSSLTSCSKKRAPAESVTIDQPHPPDLTKGEQLLATLERTGCYGECPIYRLTVATDGSIVYVGTRWVRVLGRREYKLSEAQLTDLQSAFERANFMLLRDYDHVESTDDDWAHLSFQRGGKLKRVRHYHGDSAAPPALSALEDEFDRIAGSAEFVGLPAGASASSANAMPLNPSPSPSPSETARPTPSKSTTPPKPSEAAGPPDETPADPDNHP